MGRIDTITAPELENYLSENLKDVMEVIFDFVSLSYMANLICIFHGMQFVGISAFGLSRFLGTDGVWVSFFVAAWFYPSYLVFAAGAMVGEYDIWLWRNENKKSGILKWAVLPLSLGCS